MNEWSNRVLLHMKSLHMRRAIKDLERASVWSGAVDLYYYLSRCHYRITVREKHRFADMQLAAWKYKHNPPPKTDETMRERQAYYAFHKLTDTMTPEQMEALNRSVAPELTEQMRLMYLERESIPQKVVAEWQTGHEHEAKRLIYRYYRLGCDWQDLHNQRYEMVMDRALALRANASNE